MLKSCPDASVADFRRRCIQVAFARHVTSSLYPTFVMPPGQCPGRLVRPDKPRRTADGDWPGWHYESGYNDRSQHGVQATLNASPTENPLTDASGTDFSIGGSTLAWSSSNADAASLPPLAQLKRRSKSVPIKPTQTSDGPVDETFVTLLLQQRVWRVRNENGCHPHRGFY